MFVPGFLEAESAEILRALVAALPAGKRERVDGIPFAFDRETSEVNAFAGCENGASFMAMTLPLARASRSRPSARWACGAAAAGACAESRALRPTE